MNKNFLVFDEGQDGGSVTPVTPPADGSVAPATPPVPSQDAEKADLDAVRAKYELDLRQLKSTLQRNEALLTKELDKRDKQYREDLDRLRRSTLDADELKVYEAEYAKSNLADLEQKYNEAQTTLAQERALRETISLFAQEGIPVDILVKASEDGLDGVTTAAWKYLFEENKRLSAAATTTSTPLKTTPPPIAPATDTGTAPAFTGPKWKELEERYGSREVVYSLVEAGRLPANIIPLEG